MAQILTVGDKYDKWDIFQDTLKEASIAKQMQQTLVGRNCEQKACY